MDVTALQQRLQKSEGRTDFMYRCTGGEVTVGVGHAIQTPEDALKFVWQINGVPATREQILADYKKIAAAPLRLIASKYGPMTKCRLTQAEIDSINAADVRKFEDALRERLPDWDSYPESAQVALFDMAFNLGVNGLFTKFPRMIAAVKAREWATAAAQCHRNGIQEERNQETAELFLKARSGAAVAS
jgi:GH24 family phage-related lysozyme (muramidase)